MKTGLRHRLLAGFAAVCLVALAACGGGGGGSSSGGDGGAAGETKNGTPALDGAVASAMQPQWKRALLGRPDQLDDPP